MPADRGAAPAGPEREAAVKQFTYLLNAFEDAAQAEKPAQAGYLAKRQAVLKFVADLVATGERPAEAPSEALALVNEQAEDGGLWGEAITVMEAYVQQELRALHAAVERDALRSVAAAPARK